MPLNTGILFALATMIGFGAYPVFSKNLTLRYGAYVTSFYAHLIAWIVVIAALLPGFTFVIPQNKIIALIIFQGFLGASVIGMMFLAYTKTKVSLAVSLISTYPLLVLLASLFIYNESFTTMKIIACILIVLGAWIIVTEFSDITKGKKKGLVVILAAMFLLALNVTLMKPIVIDIGGRATSIYIQTVTVLGLLGYIIAMKRKIVKPTKKFLLPGLFIGLSVSCMFFAIEKLGIGITAVIVAGSPLVAALISWLYLKEKLNKKHILGILTVVAGIILISL